MDFSEGIAKRTRAQWDLFYKEDYERRKREKKKNAKCEKSKEEGDTEKGEEEGSSEGSCLGSDGSVKKKKLDSGEVERDQKKKEIVVIDSDDIHEKSHASSKGSYLRRKRLARCVFDEVEEEEEENEVLHMRKGKKVLQKYVVKVMEDDVEDAQDHHHEDKGDYENNGPPLDGGSGYKPQHQYPTYYQSPTLSHHLHSPNQALVAQGDLSASLANEEDNFVEREEGVWEGSSESPSAEGSCLQGSDVDGERENEGETHFCKSSLIKDFGLRSKSSENEKNIVVGFRDCNISDDDVKVDAVGDEMICRKIKRDMRETTEDEVVKGNFDILSDLQRTGLDEEREEGKVADMDIDSCDTYSDKGDAVKGEDNNDNIEGDGDNEEEDDNDDDTDNDDEDDDDDDDDDDDSNEDDDNSDDGDGDGGDKKGEASGTPICEEFYEDCPSHMYNCFDPYSSADSSVHTVGHDRKQYGPHKYQYQNLTYCQSWSSPNEPYNPTHPAAVNVRNLAWSMQNGTSIPPRQGQSTFLNLNSSYVRGVSPADIPASRYQQHEFNYDGMSTHVPWFNGPNYKSRSDRTVFFPKVPHTNNIQTSSNQNLCVLPNLMTSSSPRTAFWGLQSPRPISAISRLEYVHRKFPSNTAYEPCGSYPRTVGGYNPRSNGRGWGPVDCVPKPQVIGYCCVPTRGPGPRARGFNNQNQCFHPTTHRVPSLHLQRPFAYPNNTMSSPYGSSGNGRGGRAPEGVSSAQIVRGSSLTVVHFG